MAKTWEHNFTMWLVKLERLEIRELSTPPTRGVHPSKTFLHPPTLALIGGVNSSYTPDEVHVVLVIIIRLL